MKGQRLFNVLEVVSYLFYGFAVGAGLYLVTDIGVSWHLLAVQPTVMGIIQQILSAFGLFLALAFTLSANLLMAWHRAEKAIPYHIGEQRTMLIIGMAFYMLVILVMPKFRFLTSIKHTFVFRYIVQATTLLLTGIIALKAGTAIRRYRKYSLKQA